MKYMGSKNKLSKELVPIIQSYIDNYDCKIYIEPFVGGANIIDKIKCEKKYGYDIHKHLIALLNQAKIDCSIFPKTFTEELYKDVKNNMNNGKYDDWFIGLVGFCSFGGKWFGGYPRGFKNDGKTKRDIVSLTIRNLIRQSEHLKNIEFICCYFKNIKNIKNAVIYCDPPYKNTTNYNTTHFSHDKFYNWCRELSKHNIVLISEYTMPNDFECIWEKSVKTSLPKNYHLNKVEKLFLMKGCDFK